MNARGDQELSTNTSACFDLRSFFPFFKKITFFFRWSLDPFSFPNASSVTSFSSLIANNNNEPIDNLADFLMEQPEPVLLRQAASHWRAQRWRDPAVWTDAYPEYDVTVHVPAESQIRMHSRHADQSLAHAPNVNFTRPWVEASLDVRHLFQATHLVYHMVNMKYVLFTQRFVFRSFLIVRQQTTETFLLLCNATSIYYHLCCRGGHL